MIRMMKKSFGFIPAGVFWTWIRGAGVALAAQCEEAPPDLSTFETASWVSLAAGFALVFPAILLDRKRLKMLFGGLSILPFAVWIYVNYGVDYVAINKEIFNLDVRAEQTLANIAEAQERYKSEQGEYIKDLSQIKSHLAGAHGLDECVEILNLEVGYEHWSATARHVSSPNTVTWDSTSGSSLKKG